VQSGPTTLLLLWGGDKSTQTADIRKAQAYWVEYQRRRREHDEAH
jgi:putative component of toxin-antitoxin plasmid stabilization module